MAEKTLKLQVLETIAALMTAAFGLIAALAWNEAIRELINEYLEKGTGIIALFIYAVIVTIVAIVAMLMIARSLGRLKKQIEESK